MSMEFFLTGNRLSADELQALAMGLVEDGKLSIYYPPTVQDGGDGKSYMTVEGPGSIRGVGVCHGPKQVDVTFNSFASRLDFRNGMLLLRRAMEQGGGTLEDENGTAYTAKDLNLKLAEALATDYFCFCVNAAREQCRQHGTMEIQGEMCWIALGVDDFPPTTPATIEATEAHLVARVRPYLEAFRAQTMLLNNGARLATWALIPTLIGRVTHVMVNDGNDSVVAYETLLKILGDRAEVMRDGEYTFLPALDARNVDDRVLIALLGTMADETFGQAAGTEDGAAEAAGEDGEGSDDLDSVLAEVMADEAFMDTAPFALELLGNTEIVLNAVAYVVCETCEETPQREIVATLAESLGGAYYAATVTRLGMMAFDLYAVEDLEAKEVRDRLMAAGDMSKELATAVVKGVIAGLKAAADEGDGADGEAGAPAPKAATPAKASGNPKKRKFTTKRPSTRPASDTGETRVRRIDEATFNAIVVDLATAISTGKLDEAVIAKLAKKHGREVEEIQFGCRVIYEIFVAIQGLKEAGRDFVDADIYRALAAKGIKEEMAAPFLKALAEG